LLAVAVPVALATAPEQVAVELEEQLLGFLPD
jgi:hypothetical protein